MSLQHGSISALKNACLKPRNYGNFILPWEADLTPNPILKVLFTFRKFKVKSLLIGGQACIIYGAIEFSRDSDFVVIATPENLKNIKSALDSLQAKRVYFPELTSEYLERGHACHFLCGHSEVKDLRVDIISKLRGCDCFEKLWERRYAFRLDETGTIDIIGLRDLVQSKKTQRDKDWLMLSRLVENDIIKNRKNPGRDQIKWWLAQARNPATLIELASRFPGLAEETAQERPLLKWAVKKDSGQLAIELKNEENKERNSDTAYWQPLKKELEALRHKSLSG